MNEEAYGGLHTSSTGSWMQLPSNQHEEVERWQAPPGVPCARPPRLLLVDDTPGAEFEVALPLAQAGLAVLRVRSGNTALEVLEREACDLVLLDAAPAGMSGFQLCREIRQRCMTPVVFLASNGTLPERLLAFDMGADDYIQRPAAAEEIERRIRAVLRRASPGVGTMCLDGPSGLCLGLVEHKLQVRGATIFATPKEFDLLRLLLEHRGEVMTGVQISLAIWGYETMGSRNFVEAHMSRLRAKLANAGARGVIETVRGVGYVIR